MDPFENEHSGEFVLEEGGPTENVGRSLSGSLGRYLYGKRSGKRTDAIP